MIRFPTVLVSILFYLVVVHLERQAFAFVVKIPLPIGFVGALHAPTCMATGSDRGSVDGARAHTIWLSPSSAQAKSLTAEQEQEDEFLLNEKLMSIAQKFKLEVFDLDEGIFGLDSKDNRYAIEVIKTQINVKDGGGLGLVLTEMASSRTMNDDRGLVLVSNVMGNALHARPVPVRVGDCITGVLTSDHKTVRERTVGLNYDRTVEAITTVKDAAIHDVGDYTIILELNRLVERAKITVQVIDDEGAASTGSGDGSTKDDTQTIQALAGENLRRLLLRKHVRLYNRQTKRFDMPYATGDCAGEGLCGTCLVAIEQGQELLNPKGPDEELITRGRPASWRASCRAVIGADNQPGTIKLHTKPQTKFEDEINPGVRSLK